MSSPSGKRAVRAESCIECHGCVEQHKRTVKHKGMPEMGVLATTLPLQPLEGQGPPRLPSTAP